MYLDSRDWKTWGNRETLVKNRLPPRGNQSPIKSFISKSIYNCFRSNLNSSINLVVCCIWRENCNTVNMYKPRMLLSRITCRVSVTSHHLLSLSSDSLKKRSRHDATFDTNTKCSPGIQFWWLALSRSCGRSCTGGSRGESPCSGSCRETWDRHRTLVRTQVFFTW